jgi:probable HAF family extracellular repeat protein
MSRPAHVLALALLTAVIGVSSALGANQSATRHGGTGSVAKRYPYTVVDLGTFGGPNSQQNPGRSLLNDGTAIGANADTPVPDPNAPICFSDCYVSPAFEWLHGQLLNLGALPGPNSSCAVWLSDNHLVAGVSENGVNQEAGWQRTEAVLWRNGSMIDLGALGGDQSSAAAVNDQGQVVGTALNGVTDPVPNNAGLVGNANCDTPINTTEARAFLWQNGVMHDLGTLGGPDAGANFINNRRQVAGQSFTNATVNASTGYPTLDPFLWQNGKMQDLGTLGGTSGMATWLTQSGLVIGTSDLAGDQTHHAFRFVGTLHDLGTLGGANSEAMEANDAGDIVGRADFSPSSPYHHAYLWRNGKMTDLGTVDGGPNSTAYGLNAHDQIVGEGSNDHAWLWQNGTIADLNTLIPPSSDINVVAAAAINDSGDIYGMGQTRNGDQHVILLVPNKSLQ